MSERFGTLKSYVEAPKWARVKDFLYDLSFKFNCDLTILDHEKRWLTEFIAFKYSGNETNLRALNQALKNAMEAYNRDPFISDVYPVKEAIFKLCEDSSLELEIKVKKWSKIKEMIKSAGEYHNVGISISEKNIGLLEKNISVNVLSDDKSSIQKFKKSVEDHIKSKNVVFVEQKIEKNFNFKR